MKKWQHEFNLMKGGSLIHKMNEINGIHGIDKKFNEMILSAT
jgi:hypothetical protein